MKNCVATAYEVCYVSDVSTKQNKNDSDNHMYTVHTIYVNVCLCIDTLTRGTGRWLAAN